MFAQNLDASNDLQLARMLEYLPDISKNEIKPFILISLRELKGADVRVGGVNVSSFTAVRALVRYLLRNKDVAGKIEDLKRFLSSLNLKQGCADEIVLALKDALSPGVMVPSIPNPRLLTGFQWRIDISLLSQSDQNDKSTYARNMSVVLYIKTADSTARAVRLTTHSMQVLRHAVAAALHSMLRIESRRCMKS